MRQVRARIEVSLRAFVVALLAAGLLGVPHVGEGQPAGKIYRIGVLHRGAGPLPHLDAAFQHGLRELGYVVGQNVVLERRSARGDVGRLHELAAELVRVKVDLILAVGDEVIDAARQATSRIPIIMIACDAVEAGLVQSLARPGGNITGITCISGDLAGKRLQLLREAVPRFTRLAVLYNPGDPHAVLEVRKAQLIAREWRVEVQALEARVSTDLQGRFRTMANQRADALYVIGDSFTVLHAKEIIELAAKARLPAIYAYRQFPDAGGLIAYGPNLVDMFRRVAMYVDKVLRGISPVELPVEQPTKFELVINMKAAKALGLAVPPALLLQAEVVE
ncbi:MAG: ABC transporter substrate-binding protein [Candidatus Rokubacteria bacterium]|nr:ABC transporter substrate-binding protein [Candidatus Rokubacteria bacterium]